MAFNHLTVFAICVLACYCGEVHAEEVPDPDASGVLLQVKAKKHVFKQMEPPVLTGNTFDIPFRVVAFHHPDGTEITSRGYGTIPGPTMRWTPGDEITLTLTNELTEPNPGCSPGDEICYLNTTNFHLHGLHISGEEPQDNVFVKVGPGDSYTYHYSLRADHMGGTHWYHPHWHHATSKQAGGGAHGLLIVEDLPGSLPSIVADAPEILVIMSMLNFEVLGYNPNVAEGEDSLMKVHENAEDACLVNGNLKPSLTLEAGKWTRLRMLYAAIERTLHIPKPDGCEFQLIAKDGIYLSVAPRSVERLMFGPGNRADVMVKCAAAGVYSVNTVGQTMVKGLGFALDETYNDKLLDLDVQANTGGEDSPIQPFKTRRPCYLADLSNEAVDESNKHRLGLHPEESELTAEYMGPYMKKGKTVPGYFHKVFHVSFDGEGESWPSQKHKPPPSATFEVGTVQEWEVGGLKIHPLHIHVGPFQITSGMGHAPGSGEFFEDGDWHDTYLADPETGSDVATVRFAPDMYTGNYVLHCHLLTHEDFGMMTYFTATGTEGTVYAGAEAADPTCYRPDSVEAGYTEV
jgi:FtsP/CotA-like multicopper oxidase with cupredoxin domain